MGLRIGTNIGALTALRNINQSLFREITNLQQLTTGLRISRAYEAFADLILYNQMRDQLTGISQAIENTQIATNLTRTAEEGLLHSTWKCNAFKNL